MSKKKRVLAINGGGSRFLIPLVVLFEIEKRSGKKTSELFDIVSGASSGAILAAGALLRGTGLLPAINNLSQEEIIDFFIDVVIPKAFGKKEFLPFLFPLFPPFPFRPIYPATNLVNSTQSIIPQEILLGDLKHQLLVLTYNIQTQRPIIFDSSDPIYSKISVADVVQASSASPVAFPPSLIEIDGKLQPLIDGATAANNPIIVAVSEAIDSLKRKDSSFTKEDLVVVNLGTGINNTAVPFSKARNWGFIQWTIPFAIQTVLGSSELATKAAEKIVDTGQFFYFDSRLPIKSLSVNTSNRKTLRSFVEIGKRIVKENSDAIDRLVKELIE